MTTIAERLGPELAQTYGDGLRMLDSIVAITRQDCPMMLPIVGPLCDLFATLMLRVADLERAVSDLGEPSP